MSSRSSTRLREAQMKAEQIDNSLNTTSSTSSGTKKQTSKTQSDGSANNSVAETLTSASVRSKRGSTRGIIKNEDGELNEETLARLKIEADEYRRALAAEKRNSNKRTSAAMGGKSSKKIKDEGEEIEGKSVTGSIGTTKKSKFATKEPVGWEITLDRLREFRLQNPAPVDTMGCERLAEVGEHIPPEVSRFQTLMSLVLSSQTKDTVTSVAVWRLQKELKGGLTIKGVLDVPSEELNSIIGAVGFHNKKTVFMKQIAEICRTKYNGDIPDTAEALIALPGVGPKMAYLTLQCAWNKNFGIGVDTHVHRIANRLGWIKTEKDGPEGTREALQSWLPKEHWREINHILVGFGQVLCLPRGPLCGSCPVQERCPSAVVKNPRTKVKAEIKIETALEREEPFGEVEIHNVHAKVESTSFEDADEKQSGVNGEVKEEQEDGVTSAFFNKDAEKDVEVKEELVTGHTSMLNGGLLVDGSNLEKESADIEDLIT